MTKRAFDPEINHFQNDVLNRLFSSDKMILNYLFMNSRAKKIFERCPINSGNRG